MTTLPGTTFSVFPPDVLGLSQGGMCQSLAAAINRQLIEELNFSTTPTSLHSKWTHRLPPNSFKTLATHVSLKLEEGDFKSAVNYDCSEAITTDMSEATLLTLKQKHPSPHLGSHVPQFPQDSVMISNFMYVEKVTKGIRSFPNGSAGGPYSLRLQHLKDTAEQAG